SDEKKRPTYTLAIKNYKRFLGRKEITSIGRKKAEWIHGELKVRVNPELRLQIKGDDCIIKLYFKESKLTKKKIAIILYLIAITLNEHSTAATKYCVSDIQNETLHKDSKP